MSRPGRATRQRIQSLAQPAAQPPSMRNPWRYSDISAQILCAHNSINTGLFPDLQIYIDLIQSLTTFPWLHTLFSVVPPPLWKNFLESLRYQFYRRILIPIPIPIVSIPVSMPQVFWTTLGCTLCCRAVCAALADLEYRSHMIDYVILTIILTVGFAL